ncbi:MAG: tRNA-guanine transglycosylase [Chloroflexi bacterium]|nr:MAG: tRNA-guanine transglycosylase [Chloroflexota bacterium]
MRQVLDLPNGRLQLPAFLPDGTQGVVKAIDAQDIARSQVQAVQMNGYHLMQRPGSSTIQALGGLHAMSGWQRPIFTDSGGFQVYSLIRQNPKSGRITDKGATFRIESKKFNFTPEKSIQLQMSYGADVIICLDDCTHVNDAYDVQAAAVQRTVAWARRCRTEFDRLVAAKGLSVDAQPKLVAVVQGGGEKALRQQCAEQLLNIGFDGFGYGGWPLDKDNQLLIDVLGWVREFIPREFTIHALGVGHPHNVVACARLGYELFDSTMPTRDARHGRLYTFAVDPQAEQLAGSWFEYIYVRDKKHIKTNLPISEFCDCHTCTHYTLGYLHHLHKVNDSLYPRLATIHNLRFMTMMMGALRAEVRRQTNEG